MDENQQKEDQKQSMDELDLIIRKWIVMSQWQKDQDWYKNLKEQYE